MKQIKILSETGMKECNAVQAPLEFGLKLLKSQEEQSIDEKEYRRRIDVYVIYSTHDRILRLASVC